ncbi:MAG: GDSL-type esterase/lipase family protein [Desulforhopalus sp.]
MTQLLFLGDSLVADHDWQKRMPSFKIANFGVPGVLATDLLASLPDIKQKAEYADVIMVGVGTNDLLSGDQDFISTLKKIFVQLSHEYPTAEIVVNSIFPMKLPELPDYTIPNLNSHIEAFSMQTGCCFLDTHSRFSDSDQPIFQEDGVHITEEAYEIWARVLLEHIAFLIEND